MLISIMYKLYIEVYQNKCKYIHLILNKYYFLFNKIKISYSRVNHLDSICIIHLIYYSYVTIFISLYHHIRSIRSITKLFIGKIINPLVTCLTV